MIKDVLRPRDIGKYCALCGRSFDRVASDDEHIFPKWLQHHHDLWTKRLTIPNFVGKSYKSVKIRICKKCNNERYGREETVLSKLVTSSDPFGACANVSDDTLATWLGKISWLLCRKSHSVEDFTTRNDASPQRIVPDELLPGTLYLGMFQRTFAMQKGMYSCFANDPPVPLLYGSPYSLYRYRIDTRDKRFESFDFVDNVALLGSAIRSGNIGKICLFDGGLHARFRKLRFNFLANEQLHPMQFNELVGRFFYDQTVLDPSACELTYYWNRPLNSVVAQTHSRRSFDPYLQSNHDPARFAQFVGRHTFADPSTIILENGKRVFTMLEDHEGRFLRYAVTDEELEAARRDPNQIVRGPLDTKWRTKQPPEVD